MSVEIAVLVLFKIPWCWTKWPEWPLLDVLIETGTTIPARVLVVNQKTGKRFLHGEVLSDHDLRTYNGKY